MTNPWKITTIALVGAIAVAVTSGLTTAYLLHATAPAATIAVPRVFAEGVSKERVMPARRPPIVRVTRTMAPASAIRPVVAPTAPDTLPSSVPTTAAEAAAEPTAARSAEPDAGAGVPEARADVPAGGTAAASDLTPTPVPESCVTGADRAWRIAKPGAVGTLLGAGVGAAGGAIADGGNGAGQGALWGGLAGAVVGSGWGAYRTHQECGTIFGDAAMR